MTITVAGQADVRQRLNAEGLAALGLAGPLLSPAWTPTVPTVSESGLSFTVASMWHAPIAGMLLAVADAATLGLSRLDGSPAVPASTPGFVFKIHAQARLRLERLFVQYLQSGGPVDQSVRPVPSLFLVRSGSSISNAFGLAPGEQLIPPGDVTCYDEHGLAVDPFSFAAACAAIMLADLTLAAPMPSGSPTGTPAAIAGAVTAGRLVHLVDLHGRPWSDPPGTTPGVSFYTGAPGSRTEAGHLGDGTLHAWPTGAVISGRADPDGAQAPPPPGLLRFGFSTLGRMSTAPLALPPAGAQTPTRETFRVAVTDPVFHLLGNRAAASRDDVGGADAVTVAEDSPLVRDGSPVSLLADGRSCLGFFQQVILGLQGGNPANPFTSGPIFGASPAYDDGAWPMPLAPGAAGQWPVSPAATPVNGNDGAVLASLQPLRTATTAAWVSGSNDVVVTLPSGLPAGVALRLYPVHVLLGTSPDEQPLLVRADGAGTVTMGAADTIILSDPFRLGVAPVRSGSPKVRADAVVSWLPTSGGPPVVKLIGNLMWSVGAEVTRPAAPPTNMLATMFWRGSASSPMFGTPSAGSFTLATVFADPIAFVQSVVRQMTTDQNPRQAPRLPTMARTEALLALQLPSSSGTDLYRAVLTGGWLTREADSHSLRLGNPAAAGEHEVQAPGIAASSQLGFDLWVAAAHRARPLVPTADVAGPLSGGPNAGLPVDWVMLQANTTSVPPAPPSAPSTIAASVLQTVPAYVETPELALIPDDDLPAVQNFITSTLPNYLTVPNQTEIDRQVLREVRSCKNGRRDAQWALRRAIRHARELVYVETPLVSPTKASAGGPSDSAAAVDIWTELANRLSVEPRLRVVILVPRVPPFATGYEPWSMFFYAARWNVLQTLELAAGSLPSADGKPRPRVVVAHPMGVPGRPLVIRTTTVIVDDVWMSSGTSSLSRRGLTFDGANDVVLTDWQLDRGASSAIRAHRKALMAAHLGVGPGTAGVGGGAAPSPAGVPYADYVRLHQPVSAHEAFADVMAAGGLGKLLPLWAGPDPLAPDAVIPHPAEVADPDGRGGATLVTTIASAITGMSAPV